MEDHLGFILRGNPGEILALSFWNAELFVGVFDGIGKIIPVIDLATRWLDVVVNVIKVEIWHVDGEPRGHGSRFEALERLEAEISHPVRLILDFGHFAHDGFVQALFGLEDVILGVAPPKLVTAKVKIFDSHLSSNARPELVLST